MTEYALMKRSPAGFRYIVDIVTTERSMVSMREDYPEYEIDFVSALPFTILSKYRYFEERP